MGLFSYTCRRCSIAIASSADFVEPINNWMRYAIALKMDGSPLVGGLYDGYGRITEIYDDDAIPLDEGGNEIHCYPHCEMESILLPEIYHYACYLRYGATEKRGPSEYDSGQGGFTDPLPPLSCPEPHRAVKEAQKSILDLQELMRLDEPEEAADWLKEDSWSFEKIVSNLSDDQVESNGAVHIYGVISGLAFASGIDRNELLKMGEGE